MKGATGSRLSLATVILLATICGPPETIGAESKRAEEIVIHYHIGTAALPAPRREGNTYVIAIPQSLSPVPEKLIAPFVNTIEGGNEVWRFELKENSAVTVSQMDAGTIRVRFAEPGNMPAVEKSEPPLPRSAAAVEHSATPPASNVAEKALSRSAPVPAPLNVDANGSALTVAAVNADSDIATVQDNTLPLANLDLAVPQSPAFAILGITFFDLGDPRLDQEYIDKLSTAFDDLGFIDPMNPNAIVTARTHWLATVDKIRKDAKARNWNRSSWSLGLAPSWIDQTGDSGNYEWNGGAAWTSLAYGFDTEPFLNTGLDKTSQLILHLRYRNHEQVPDTAATGSFYTQDSALAALRLRLGSPEFNVALDGAYVREWNSGSHDGSSYRLAFIVERKMAANLWFRLSYGKEFDAPDGKDSSLFLGSFHLGASEEAPLPAAR